MSAAQGNEALVSCAVLHNTEQRMLGGRKKGGLWEGRGGKTKRGANGIFLPQSCALPKDQDVKLPELLMHPPSIHLFHFSPFCPVFQTRVSLRSYQERFSEVKAKQTQKNAHQQGNDAAPRPPTSRPEPGIR